MLLASSSDLSTMGRVPCSSLAAHWCKYQVLWRGFSCEQQEAMLKILALAFGGDPACTSVDKTPREASMQVRYSPKLRATPARPPEASVWKQAAHRNQAG